MKRKMLSIMLALVLIVCMAIPAFAASRSGYIDGKQWNFNYYLTSSSGSCETQFIDSTQLMAYVEVHGWCNMHGADATDSRTVYDNGNARAYCSNNLLIPATNTYHDCVLDYAVFSGKVGSVYVANRVSLSL